MQPMPSHREVGHELEKSRVRHRQPGIIPYPLQHDDRNVLDLYVLIQAICVASILIASVAARGTICFSRESISE